jgi:predicted nuclease of predicted toxin-antitoxin system
MKFLLDMNLAPRWTEFLDTAEIEATHWSRIGDPGASDYELLNWAAANDHIVITADLDFPAILASTKAQRPSVILIRSDLLSPEFVGPAVLEVIRMAAKELTAGAIVTLDPARSRIRLLPLPG